MQGNHRMAALAHLQKTQIKVRADLFVRELDLHKWPQVANNRCSEEHARAIFRFFFEENGWHIEERLQ